MSELDTADISKSSFTILGAGRSGLAVAKLLKKIGAKVFLSDGQSESKLKYLDKDLLNSKGIEFETGGHSERIYENEIFVKSPGIGMDSEPVKRALDSGKKVFSEIEAAYWVCPCPVIAITGTNGKTTTTVLAGEILKNAGYDVKVCGNVGLAFSEVIDELREDSVVILEVSSFQLESVESFKPRVAMFLNFKADHLDWHKNIDNYFRAKMKIAANQDERDLFVYNADDEYIAGHLTELKARKSVFSLKTDLSKSSYNMGCYLGNSIVKYIDKDDVTEDIIAKDEIFIKGSHNVYNSMAGIICAKEFGVSSEIIAETLKSFQGVEHRIEFVRELNGVKYYNDSKATNIDSTKMALESFSGNVIILLGGLRGESDFSGLSDLIKEKAKKVIAVGEAKENIEDFFKSIKDVVTVNSFEEAVKEAKKTAESGDVVLLSPAHKSFDMFDDFEERGREFKQLVNNLK